MTSLEYPRSACAVEQTLGGVALSDRYKPLIAAKCGPTVALRAAHVRFLINRFQLLHTGVHGRPAGLLRLGAWPIRPKTTLPGLHRLDHRDHLAAALARRPLEGVDAGSWVIKSDPEELQERAAEVVPFAFC